jgi:hypothetical protein
MRNDEEVIALENRNNIQKEEDDEIEEPFKISKKGLEILMNNYLSRKLDEELVFLERRGGMCFLEEALCTSYSRGLTDTDDYLARKKIFDTNEQEPEEPLSN